MHQPVDPTPCPARSDWDAVRVRTHIRELTRELFFDNRTPELDTIEHFLCYASPFMGTHAGQEYLAKARAALQSLRRTQ